ncbi:unnamed protein product [Nesidiocoris tenuis]|uniref:Uncharacterized protein n=1 Tax=Nesidiocoris tenuis TaxID=355587 RepID=A0A6H5GE34_9HEMI|nr:unnamed protein product [Nesidiocoris tenuis]
MLDYKIDVFRQFQFPQCEFLLKCSYERYCRWRKGLAVQTNYSIRQRITSSSRPWMR